MRTITDPVLSVPCFSSRSVSDNPEGIPAADAFVATREPTRLAHGRVLDQKN
jgi:hypothetical protein